VWLLAYWWQALVLILLYGFLFLVYREMKKHYLLEPAAILMVHSPWVGYGENGRSKGEIILFYPGEIWELAGEKLHIHNEHVILEKQGGAQKIMPGDIFDFAGGSLQLVRWNNARQLINQYRIGAKSQ